MEEASLVGVDEENCRDCRPTERMADRKKTIVSREKETMAVGIGGVGEEDDG